MDFKNSKTYQNLLTAMAGESMARNKYDWFASKAKKEGYNQIAEVFAHTALNEKEHAKMWFKLINDGIGSTEENLAAAANGENEEWTSMYKEFAQIAKDEGYNDIARSLEGVANIEHHHEEQYRQLLDDVKNDKVFNSDEPITWICSNCGHVHTGKFAPKTCYVCNHPQSYFFKK